jgi:hypothetical protein
MASPDQQNNPADLYMHEKMKQLLFQDTEFWSSLLSASLTDTQRTTFNIFLNSEQQTVLYWTV